MHAYIVLLNGTYDYEYAYPNSEFVTQGSTGVTKRLLLTLDSQGILEPWCQGQRMDYTNMVWGNQLAWAETAFEIGTDSKTAAPHDPANHHSSIMTQTNLGGSWLPQTESCSKFDKVEDQSGYQYPGVYNSNWTINANYNWMAHPL
jgi:hypothetical protein